MKLTTFRERITSRVILAQLAGFRNSPGTPSTGEQPKAPGAHAAAGGFLFQRTTSETQMGKTRDAEVIE